MLAYTNSSLMSESKQIFKFIYSPFKINLAHIAFFSCRFDAINSEVQIFCVRFLISDWAERQNSRESIE